LGGVGKKIKQVIYLFLDSLKYLIPMVDLPPLPHTRVVSHVALMSRPLVWTNYWNMCVKGIVNKHGCIDVCYCWIVRFKNRMECRIMAPESDKLTFTCIWKALGSKKCLPLLTFVSTAYKVLCKLLRHGLPRAMDFSVWRQSRDVRSRWWVVSVYRLCKSLRCCY